MTNFLSSNDSNEFDSKINLDDLYTRKREIELNRLTVYNKILNRVHSKIKLASRQRNNEQFTFYVVPEFIFGVSNYNVNTCISYIIDKLEENGFIVKYTHPNLLFISWGHYIPAYQREQIKKETGQKIDGFGNPITDKKRGKGGNKSNDDPEDINSLMINASKKSTGNGSGSGSGSSRDSNSSGKGKNDKKYKDINSYKPQGIYNMDFLSQIKDKL
jgi:hypothetical protein